MAFIQQKCDFCDDMALYDGKTIMGPWAFMCKVHFKKHGTSTPGFYTELQPSNTTKQCARCNQAKPLAEFEKYRDSISGIERYRTVCKHCTNRLKG